MMTGRQVWLFVGCNEEIISMSYYCTWYLQACWHRYLIVLKRDINITRVGRGIVYSLHKPRYIMRSKLVLCLITLLVCCLPILSKKTTNNVVVKKSTSTRTHVTSSAAINGIKNSIASGLAAACSKTALAPFDTIKTVQQQARNGGKALGLIEAAKVILSRPKGFLELYVSTDVFSLVIWEMSSVIFLIWTLRQNTFYLLRLVWELL